MYSSNNPFRQYSEYDGASNTLAIDHTNTELDSENDFIQFTQCIQHLHIDSDTRNSVKLYKVLPIVKSYMKSNQVHQCLLVNKAFSAIFSSVIWEKPDFKGLSHIHDELYMLNKFLSHLSLVSKTTLQQIISLDLSFIEESLYETVNPNFFKIIVKYCPELTTLNLSNAHYFHRKSLPLDSLWKLDKLTVLNLSNCPQVNDDMIVSIARGCRHLTHVELDHLVRHKGNGVACLAAECDSLSSVSMRYNTLLEDDALVALAKFLHIRLLELDITGCKRITSIGLNAVGRYSAHLKSLSLAQTTCQLSDLVKLCCISRRTEYLDISSCKKLKSQQHALAEWIWNTEFPCLKRLVMDSATVDALCKMARIQLIDVQSHVRHLTHLVCANLPEHTPMAYLYTLLKVFPNLQQITFKRAYFETDFMLGLYRSSSPDDQEYITDIGLEQFNKTQSKIIANMIHERENDIDCSLKNW